MTEGNCFVARRGWGAAGGERTARRMTNPFRRRGAASLLTHGEAWVIRPAERVEEQFKNDARAHNVVGGGMFGRRDKGSGETCAACASRAGVRARILPLRLRPEGTDRGRTGQHNPRAREGGQEGGCAMNGTRQQNAGSADEATQGGEAQRDFTWVEASVWTERMLSALGNGVKPYLNTDFSQAIDFACNLAKFSATWHYASENRIFALYIGICAVLATRFD